MPLLPGVAAAATAAGALEAGRAATRALEAAGFLEGFLPEDLGVLTVGAATCIFFEKNL